MSLVRALVVAHLSITAALLLVFACVVLCQRLTASARTSSRATTLPSRLPEPYPSEPGLSQPLHVPAQEGARREVPAAGASVLDWTIDLRTPDGSAGRPAAAGSALQTSS